MSSRDDDYLDRDVPAPEADATAAERSHAKTFGDIVDKAIAGRPPVAMSADARALLEVATVIRAAAGSAELPASRQRSIVEDALQHAVGGEEGRASVVSLDRERSRRRWLPWTVSATTTAIAAAAVLALWLRAPERGTVADEAAVPETWTSRPADPLIGRIAPDQSGAASERIDAIFADRLDGYRERRWSGRGGAR